MPYTAGGHTYNYYFCTNSVQVGKQCRYYATVSNIGFGGYAAYHFNYTYRYVLADYAGGHWAYLDSASGIDGFNISSANFESNIPGFFVPCTSWTYSNWEECQIYGTQTRTVLTSSPSGCMGGAPVTTQSCEYVTPPQLTVAVEPLTGGSVTGSGIDCGAGTTNDCQEDYISQEEIVLTANPASGYAFAYWREDTVQIVDNPYLGSMVADKSLTAVFVPDMKLPLPGGKSWELTVQMGGAVDCSIPDGPDYAHTGNGFYSLDFNDARQGDNQELVQEYDVPIYAVASGVIDSYGYDPDGFGNWVMIDHQNGYKTRYAHMLSQALITSGNVTMGDQLGTVGTTGNSTGTHLHFQIYYGGSSASTVTELSLIKMEGLPLSDYTVGCHAYYPSTNTQ